MLFLDSIRIHHRLILSDDVNQHLRIDEHCLKKYDCEGPLKLLPMQAYCFRLTWLESRIDNEHLPLSRSWDASESFCFSDLVSSSKCLNYYADHLKYWYLVSELEENSPRNLERYLEACLLHFNDYFMQLLQLTRS